MANNPAPGSRRREGLRFIYDLSVDRSESLSTQNPTPRPHHDAPGQPSSAMWASQPDRVVMAAPPVRTAHRDSTRSTATSHTGARTIRPSPPTTNPSHDRCPAQVRRSPGGGRGTVLLGLRLNLRSPIEQELVDLHDAERPSPLDRLDDSRSRPLSVGVEREELEDWVQAVELELPRPPGFLPGDDALRAHEGLQLQHRSHRQPALLGLQLPDRVTARARSLLPSQGSGLVSPGRDRGYGEERCDHQSSHQEPSRPSCRLPP